MVIACSIFRQKLLEFSTSRIPQTSEFLFLMSQFMLVMSQQLTVTLELRIQASANRSDSRQSNHELGLQIIADFMVII